MRCLASSPWTNASTLSSASSAAGSLFPVTSATAPKTQSTTVAIFRILLPPTDACLTERASPAFQFQNPNPIPRQLPTKQRLSILGLKFSRRVVHQLASRSQWPGPSAEKPSSPHDPSHGKPNHRRQGHSSTKTTPANAPKLHPKNPQSPTIHVAQIVLCKEGC